MCVYTIEMSVRIKDCSFLMREGLRRCILKMEVLIKVKTVERGGTNPEKISYEKTETEAHDGYDKWRFYYLEDI